MADIPTGDPGVCDTRDRGVTPTRLNALQAEAHAFNHVMLVTEDGQKGAAHKAAVEEANRDFYAFLPEKQNHADGGSYEASQAFYEQVTRLPIGERKKLLQLTEAENAEMRVHNPKLPKMVVKMDSSAYLNSLDFEMSGYEYTYSYIGGMCAEVPDFNQNNPAPGQGGWSITLPTLDFRR